MRIILLFIFVFLNFCSVATANVDTMNSLPANLRPMGGSVWVLSDSVEILDHGDINRNGSLAWLLNRIESQPATVALLGSGPYKLSTSIRIPSNVTLFIPQGAKLAPSHGSTITFGGVGSLFAGDYQIFTGNSVVSFPDGIELRLAWFKDFQTAINTIGSAKVKLKIVGENRVTNDVKVPSNLTLSFPGNGDRLLLRTGVTVIIEDGCKIIAGPEQAIFFGKGTVRLESSGIVYTKWWAASTGALPNADFAQRWNDCWTNAPKARKIVSVGNAEVRGSLNLTGHWHFRRIVDFTDGTMTWKFSNEPLLDLTASRHLIVRNLRCIAAKSSDNPSVGILLARESSGKAPGPKKLENIYISGGFKVATLLNASAENQIYENCTFTNTYIDDNGRGRPAVVLTSGPAKNWNVRSKFLKLYKGLISANGHSFIACQIRSDNGVSSLDTANNNYGSAMIIRGSQGIDFVGMNYFRTNGHSALHIDVSTVPAGGIKAENLWVGGLRSNPDYAITVHGNRSKSSRLIDSIFVVFRSKPNVEELLLDGVREIRNLTFQGANRASSTNRHGLIYRNGRNVMMENCYLRAGLNGTIDLGEIKGSNSHVQAIIQVSNPSDFIPPGSDASFNGIALATLGALHLISEKHGIAIGSGSAPILRHLSGTKKTWSPDVVRDAETAETTVQVPGATPGDTVTFGYAGLDEPGWDTSAYVSKEGVVTVRVTNNSGRDIRVPDRKLLRVDVWQHP